MKAYLQDMVHASASPAHARNTVREYLQARILGVLQQCGAMIPLAFQGGTALRFLFSSARYSEDLDFALEREPSRYDLRAYLKSIRSALQAEAYTVELKLNDKGAVHSAFFKFSGLPYELGLSPRRSENLSVKIEVDTRPPGGAVMATTIVRRHVTLNLQHHDRSSLLAGKLHAVLQRPYAKGRDFYDLIWYLSDPGWPSPNLLLLNNALGQSGWDGGILDAHNWRHAVAGRLGDLDWDRIVADVSPFLDARVNRDLLTRENLMKLLGMSADSAALGPRARG
jgi:hypothetical protein